MSRIVVQKTVIFGLSHEYCLQEVVLRKEFELPFVPQRGMRVSLGGWIEDLTGVMYDADTGVFHCVPGDGLEHVDLTQREQSVESMIENYRSLGWEVLTKETY